MCRLVGWVSSRPVTLRELVGDAAVTRLMQLSTVHCHGWGVAWREAGRLHVRRSQTQASDDPDFREVVDSLSTSAAIVHLRLGTPGLGRGLDDSHPFVDGDWTLAHNGAVLPAERVGALLPASSARRPAGTTDSERWFLALRDELDATGDESPEALAGAAATVTARAAAAGLTCSSWNSLLLGPAALYVVNLHDDSWRPGEIRVWPDDPPDGAACWPPYLDLRMREARDATVVASSGIGAESGDWVLLPNATVTRVALDRSRVDSARIGDVPAERTA